MSAAPNAPAAVQPAAVQPATVHPAAAAHPAGVQPVVPQPPGHGTPADRCPQFMTAPAYAAALIAQYERGVANYKSSIDLVKPKLASTRSMLVGLGYDWKKERLNPLVPLTNDIINEINNMTRYKFYLERDKLIVKLFNKALKNAQKKEEARLQEQDRVREEARLQEEDRVREARLQEEEERVREVERLGREALAASATAGQMRRVLRRAPVRR
jgi:hypothetical protein